MKNPPGRRLLPSVAAILLLACAAVAQAALERVDDFALLDAGGEFHQLSRYRHLRALAVMAWDGDCPAMPAMAAVFTGIANQFRDRDIAFVFIDSRGIGQEALRNTALELPILDDAGQLVSAALGLAAAGEVALLNPERFVAVLPGRGGSPVRASPGGNSRRRNRRQHSNAGACWLPACLSRARRHARRAAGLRQRSGAAASSGIAACVIAAAGSARSRLTVILCCLAGPP